MLFTKKLPILPHSPRQNNNAKQINDILKAKAFLRIITVKINHEKVGIFQVVFVFSSQLRTILAEGSFRCVFGKMLHNFFESKNC